MPVTKGPPVPVVPHKVPIVDREQQNRSPSPDFAPLVAAKPQSNRLQARHPSPAPPRGRSVSAQPQNLRAVSADGYRAVSNPIIDTTRAPSTNSGGDSGSPTGLHPKMAGVVKKRKTWLPGARSRSNSVEMNHVKGTGAWIICPDAQVDYNVSLLTNGEKVPELWNEAGNVLVYLHPRETGLGPSFKVADYVFSSSLVFNQLLVQGLMERSGSISSGASSDFLQVDDALPRPAPARNAIEGHLYLPLGSTDLESLVAARNLFAFLTNQPLVATSANPSLFAAVINVAQLLRQFNFTNADGSSFGESVDAAFDLFIDQFSIADVRHSREKTIEGLVMGEAMKSWNLYNESFTHAVGKYESLLALNYPIYNQVSATTRNRLERAHLDLLNRQSNVNARIESFEYPSLFAGIANSTSHEEYRNVRYKEWRTSFARMRNFVLNYYKDLFGSWPPKARSKKNHFTQSGLNRQCLKMLYSDLCALYDLLVDRESITPRGIDQPPSPEEKDKKEVKKEKEDIVAASISALRIMLTEFERSSPPVLPPIPFDIPKIPSMTSIYETYNELPAKKQAKFDKNLQPHEMQLLLIKSHNIDTDALKMPFLLAFKDFELREAKGVHPRDLLDQRLGYWLFLYVTIQSLPMLVVDAPGLHFTEGVEYFLCEPPQGNLPWVEDAGEVRKMWYQTADQNIVELSADVVLFSSEGIYMRSHCWLAGKEWEQNLLNGGPGAMTPPIQEGGGADMMFPGSASPLQPPPRAVFQDMDPAINNNTPVSAASSQRRDSGVGSTPNSPHIRPGTARSGSPASAHRARHAYRASIAIGLEPLPLLPDGSFVGEDGRRVSRAPSGSSSPGLMDPYAVGGGGGLGVQKLRVSRSAVNLGGHQQFEGGDQQQGQRQVSYGGGAVGRLGTPPPPQTGTPPPAPTSLPPPPVGGGGGGGHGHERKDSLTFDDILKGMDKGEKKKKKLFF
ncbi:hypothetical protein QBC38DRAFT_353982 [Podospora fimiseda]|uniref:DUF8004 domain-containing protein n=1 Tax=Podospora fimiseda TaxID=252190 RepID=A0AAN7BXZ6_9PEZI|nr:hypothetical protein QBC38DRAFT_353982 [Podospora fimiseda]